MSDVFISYKSEDAVRVARLAQALETAGLSVWWDRHLAAGENWNNQIQTALDNAKCVVVVWSSQSVAPAGDFVRDEARQGKRRGVLVPVRFDKVDPPSGFGEMQAVDLTRWKGGSRDPFFNDLVAAVAAKIKGRPVPPARGPMKQLTRRATYSGFGSAIIFCVAAFGSNTFRAQDRVCIARLLQPGISDLCGALGLGGRPTKLERMAWQGRQPGSCAALRTHIERFPNGIYRAEAQGLLAARQVTQTEVWSTRERRLALFEPQTEPSSSNKTAAQNASVAAAQSSAARLCNGFAAATSFRLKSVRPVPHKWDCPSNATGITCGFEGEAVCELEERSIEEHERCGKFK